MALVPFPQKSAVPAEEPDWDEESESAEGGKMSFLEHLDELRRRLIWSVASLVFGVVVAAFFLEKRTYGPIGSHGPWSFGIFDFVFYPMKALLKPGQTLQFIEPSEAFSVYVKLAVIAGLLIASPLIMTQVWLFIAPGLYSREKRFALPFVLFSSIFFVGGVAFSHYVVFPAAWKFFASFNNDYLAFMPKVSEAFGLYAYMLLAFGVIFQMPTLVLALARMGVVTAGFLWRHTKYAVLAIFIISAVITPSSDVVNQSLMAVPMLVLYLLSIIIAWVFGRKKPSDSTR